MYTLSWSYRSIWLKITAFCQKKHELSQFSLLQGTLWITLVKYLDIGQQCFPQRNSTDLSLVGEQFQCYVKVDVRPLLGSVCPLQICPAVFCFHQLIFTLCWLVIVQMIPRGGWPHVSKYKSTWWGIYLQLNRGGESLGNIKYGSDIRGSILKALL